MAHPTESTRGYHHWLCLNKSPGSKYENFLIAVSNVLSGEGLVVGEEEVEERAFRKGAMAA